MQERNHVIKTTRAGKPDRFYTIDRSSGYPDYLEGIGSADFMTYEDAEKIIIRLVEKSTEFSTYGDGERRPKPELSAALSLSNSCLEETVTFSICKVELNVQGAPFTFTGRIEKPKGFVYK